MIAEIVRPGTFGALDWGVVAGVLIATSLFGLLFGRQATLRDFFLGGRKLPWWAVSASIVATEISAVTLVSVPWVVFQPGGNFTYVQYVLIGSVIARAVIAWKLVPAYYEREIYSPYDYMAAKLGGRARDVASALFALGGVLSQAARVYLTALVLDVLLAPELANLSKMVHVPSLGIAVGIVTAFAIAWSWLGGIVTVIWTDFLLFLVFTASAFVVLASAARGLDLGWERIVRVGVDTHRFHFFDFDTSPTRAYSFWAAAIAASFGNIGAYGVDQLMAQRIFCCKSIGDARKAVMWSCVSVVVVALFALVGVALVAWYERHAMTAAGATLVAEKGDRLLPVFVLEAVPNGLKGLVVAGILAAAISSLDGILTALSQTAITSVWTPLRARALARLAPTARPDAKSEEERAIRASRMFLIAFGFLLAAFASALGPLARNYRSTLDLALSMASYTQGALLAGFLIAYLVPGADGSGWFWSVPLSILWVFTLAWHGPHVEQITAALALVFLGVWIWRRCLPDLQSGVSRGRVMSQLFALIAGLLLIMWLGRFGEIATPRLPLSTGEVMFLPLAFPWYVPAGCVAAFTYGLVLAREPRASS